MRLSVVQQLRFQTQWLTVVFKAYQVSLNRRRCTDSHHHLSVVGDFCVFKVCVYMVKARQRIAWSFQFQSEGIIRMLFVYWTSKGQLDQFIEDKRLNEGCIFRCI